jgi:hypothetical protein
MSYFKFLLIASILCNFVNGQNNMRMKKRIRAGDGNSGIVKWGSQFAVPLDGKNVELGCTSPAGRPVCCVAMDEDNLQIRGVGYGMEDYTESTIDKVETQSCTIKKRYISSPQELREFQVAETISKIGSAEVEAFKSNNGGENEEVDNGTRLPISVHKRRLNALLNYVTSPESVANSTSWLERVKQHMSSENIPEETEADKEYLSRFEFSEICDGKVVEQWNEWIEPITVTARHPFGFGNCRPAHQIFSENKAPRKPRSDVDYVLLQSGKQLDKQEKIIINNNNNNMKMKMKNPNRNDKIKENRPRKHFMFDAGTSTFDSSLYWFTCAYSQRKVAFNDVYGWEMTILNPVEYWEKVPPKWIPYWHFYNSPISSDIKQSQSPVRIIKSITNKNDFVAFKLDIDHPDTENPVAMNLLKDLSFSNLIDEFFFELHFRCEVMTSCGWGKQVPEELAGLKLERAEVLKYFLKLREMGIRAHIWP